MQKITGNEIIIGAKMLFVVFGALVLVQLLTGLDPSIALFTAGLGTLVFQFITKKRFHFFSRLFCIYCSNSNWN